MSFIINLGTKIFPHIFSPPILGRIPPSWSGIFYRIIHPPKVSNHPIQGKIVIANISRNEERRLEDESIRELIKSFPPGKYHEIEIVDSSQILKSKNRNNDFF